MSSHTAAPVGGSQSRLLAIDAARGLALIGMVIVNVGPADPESVWHRLWLAPSGRASVLFVLVAGVALTFLFRSGRARRPWVMVAWRAALLMIGGLALGLVPHEVNVILPIYGVLYAVSLGLRYLPSWALLALAVAFAVIGPIVFITETFHHVGEQPDPLTLGEGPPNLLHSLFFTRPYPLVVWIVPFLAGMWLGRLELQNRRVQRRLIGWGFAAAVVGIVIPEIAARVYGPIEGGYGLLLTGAAHGQMPLWLISSIGSGMLMVGLLLRYWERWESKLAFLSATGQMALTLYVAHLLLLAAIRAGGSFDLMTGIAVSVAMTLTFCSIAVGWKRMFGLGPLERVLKAGWLARLAGRPRPESPGVPVVVSAKSSSARSRRNRSD